MNRAHRAQTCAPRVRIPHKGGSLYEVRRGTPRDAPAAGEDGDCDADEFGEREGDAQAQDSHSGRSIRGDDHVDVVKPRSDEQVPLKDSVAEPSGLQDGVAAPTRPHAKNPRANGKCNGNGKEQSSEAPAAPEQAARQSRPKPAVPPAQRCGHDCKEDRRKTCV
jgi:hypothetical protein